jgi:predicted GNAT family acetyltransferase
MSDIVRREDPAHKGKGAWVIERDGNTLAELSYTTAGSRVILDHTDVSDALRGTGSGKKLVIAAAEWARKSNVKLIPLCPFAKSVFDKTPEIRDVLSV